MAIVGRWFGHMPTESWWLDGSQFYARARKEQERMRLSWYGQLDTVLTANETREKPRKVARVKEPIE